MKKAIIAVIAGGLTLTIFAIAAIVGLYFLGAKRAEERTLMAGHKPTVEKQITARTSVAPAAKPVVVAKATAPVVAKSSPVTASASRAVKVAPKNVAVAPAASTSCKPETREQLVDDCGDIEAAEAPVVFYEITETGTGYWPDRYIHASTLFSWFTDDWFFEPGAIKGVHPRVDQAKEKLLRLHREGELPWLIDPVSALAVVGREVCDREDEFMLNVNCTGDKKFSFFEKARGIFQIRGEAHTWVAAINEFHLQPHDFFDPALSYMVWQAWIYQANQYAQKKCNREIAKDELLRMWNAGPTGYLENGWGYAYMNGDDRPGVLGFREMAEQLPIVIAYSTTKPSTAEQQATLVAGFEPKPESVSKGPKPDASYAGGERVGTVVMPSLVACPVADENEETGKVLTAQSSTTATNPSQFYGPAPGTAALNATVGVEASVSVSTVTPVTEGLFPSVTVQAAAQQPLGVEPAVVRALTISLPQAASTEGGTQ
ncbi:MAG: hypothetical protein RL150_139 [Candidatus Parcubacteria bacterium]|jgi:hypothetical protein